MKGESACRLVRDVCGIWFKTVDPIIVRINRKPQSNLRDGSKAALATPNCDFRFVPINGHQPTGSACPFRAPRSWEPQQPQSITLAYRVEEQFQTMLGLTMGT
jgi:hypothetical protein